MERVWINKTTRYKTTCAWCKSDCLGWDKTRSEANKAYCTRSCAKQDRDADWRANNRVTFEVLVEANNYPTGENTKVAARLANVHKSTVWKKMKEISYEWTRQWPLRAAGWTKGERNTLPEPCAVCGESRVVDAAHIIPARDGGDTSPDNTISLCPTHHKLFDTGRLSQVESKELEYIFATKIGQARRTV